MPLFADSSWVDQVFTSRNVGIALWVGLAMLTVSLIVLARTRWGQARPISKCVVLSVFAHILLFGYAYGTKLILDVPLVGDSDDEVVSLQLLTDDQQQEEQSSQTEETPAWDKFVTDEHPWPSVDSPTRRRIEDVKVKQQRSPQKSSPIAAKTMFVPLSHQEPSRPTADQPGVKIPRPQSPAGAAHPIPAPRVVKSPATKPPVTAPTRPPGPPKPPRARLPDMPLVQRNVDSLDDVQSRLQQLRDMKPSATADILLSQRDQIKQANNLPITDRSNNNLPEPVTEPPASSAQPTFHQVSRNAAGERQPTSSSNDLIDPARLPRRIGDGQKMPLTYGLRVSDDRLALARRSGGDTETEAAVEAALEWLANHQKVDGRWDASDWGSGVERRVLGHNRQGAGAEADTGISGLAILAFLAAGHSHLEGKYAETVQHGLEFLIAKQRSDGNLAGNARLFASMYCHGMAALAISEAFAMTGDHRLKPYVQKAVDYTVAAQLHDGGWRYQPGDSSGDMSQFGWQVMALKSASLAGIEIPQATQSAMRRFLNNSMRGQHRGLAGYRGSDGASRTMTAEALVCHVFLDVPKNDAQVNEAAQLIMGELPNNGKANLYYWYYATLALHQVQSKPWQQWNTALKQQLLTRQRDSGRLAGSWDPDTVWGTYGGRVYSTAMAALCLEVYYRYLPLYKE